MVKKIAAAAGAGALIIGMTMPAFAGGHRSGGTEIEVENENTLVVTTSIAKSDTGDNSQRMRKGGSQWMFTGDAGAISTAGSVVNDTTIRVGCRCLGRGGEVEVENENTLVITTAYANADTGDNSQSLGSRRRGHHGGGGLQVMSTGDAFSDSLATSGVNMTLIRVGR